jgi:hypothetical protein
MWSVEMILHGKEEKELTQRKICSVSGLFQDHNWYFWQKPLMESAVSAHTVMVQDPLAGKQF